MQDWSLFILDRLAALWALERLAEVCINHDKIFLGQHAIEPLKWCNSDLLLPAFLLPKARRVHLINTNQSTRVMLGRTTENRPLPIGPFISLLCLMAVE